MEPIKERRLNDEDQNINYIHFSSFGCLKHVTGTECRGARTGATRTGISRIDFAASAATGALIRSTSGADTHTTGAKVGKATR